MSSGFRFTILICCSTSSLLTPGAVDSHYSNPWVNSYVRCWFGGRLHVQSAARLAQVSHRWCRQRQQLDRAREFPGEVWIAWSPKARTPEGIVRPITLRKLCQVFALISQFSPGSQIPIRINTALPWHYCKPETTQIWLQKLVLTVMIYRLPAKSDLFTLLHWCKSKQHDLSIVTESLWGLESAVSTRNL